MKRQKEFILDLNCHDSRRKDLGKNSTGSFFVDSSCIDCGSCWQIDPAHFSQNIETAYVHRQPHGKKEIHEALMALVDCPVAAIRAPNSIIADCANDAFPLLITKHPQGDVYYCGWSSRKSFGASSWLIVRPEGNVLIDSPRWSNVLAKQIKRMGGISQIVLTHKDDVADHSHWAKSFNCERWIHKNDSDAAPDSEKQLIGMDMMPLGASLRLIPTPGHTKGSIVSLLGDNQQILFSGDHLWWDPEKKVVVASKRYCWWDWAEQIKSIKKLLDLKVAWLLPGHGYAHQFAPGEWKIALNQTLKYYGENEKASFN